MVHQPPRPVRCPACGQKALPMQTRCLHCNARLNEVMPAGPTAAAAVQAAEAVPPPPSDGKCPGCGMGLAEGAVLCVACGYDLRTGRKHATIHAPVEEEGDPAPPRRKRRGRELLPAGFGKVKLGLTLHYARLVLTLVGLLVFMGVVCYAGATRARAGDPGVTFGGLAAGGVCLLAALLGMIGSFLCLWVGRASRAWGFIFVSLLLDVLTLPVAAWLQVSGLPPLLAWVPAFFSWIFFMLFLRRLALYLDRPGEANECMALITRGVALLVGVPLLLVLLAQVAFLYGALARDPSVLFLLGAVSVVILIVQFVFLVKLFFSILGTIQTLRAAITNRLPRRERAKDEGPQAAPGAE